jgi:integrase
MRKKTGYIQQRGDSFRISWYDTSGVRQFETHPSIDDAQRELAQRIADTSKGIPVSSRPSTILFEELAADVIADYEVNARKSIEDQKARFRLHINPVFGFRKAAQITTAQLNRYIVERRAEEASTGTINRELEAIRHAFLLARRHGKILHSPHVPHLKERNTRTGFLTREEVDRLCSHLSKPLNSLVLFGFLTGWRLDEIRNLEWRQVDFEAGEIRLDPGTTKSGEGRVFPMGDELRDVLMKLRPVAKKARTAGKRNMPEQNVSALTPFVFALAGKKVGEFRKTWKTACHKAGLPCVVEPVKRGGKRGAVKVVKALRIFHDLRRSAAREFQRQGFTEGQIMRMCGWKTRSVFDRYAIVTDSDIREKMAVLDLKRANSGAKPASSKR